MSAGDAGALEALNELVGAMQELLVVVDENRPETAGLRRAWLRCQQVLERCRARAGEADGLTEEERAEVSRSLASATRLNAIAAELIQRRAEQLTEEIERIRTARVRVRAHGGDGGTGDAVDLVS